MRNLFVLICLFISGCISDVPVNNDIRLFSQFNSYSGDAGQCGGFTGLQKTQLGQFTQYIVIDADERAGGCMQNFGIYDPYYELKGLNITVNFYSDQNAGQCWFQGVRKIPIFSDYSAPVLSSEYVIDTDDRAGGCLLEFSISGRSDIVLDIEFGNDPLGQNNGQCGNTGFHTVSEGKSVTLRIDTDNRPGGCRMRFSLGQLAL